MSHEPSHRKPPRQERWPNATPGGGWPAYQQGDGSRAWESARAWEAAALAGSRNGHAASTNGYRDARGGHGTSNGSGDPWGDRNARHGDQGQGYAGHGYAGHGYAGHGHAGNGHAGHGYAGHGYAGHGYRTDGGAYGTPTTYPTTGDGYADGHGGAVDGYGGTADRYETGNGYDGWDGYAQPGHEFTGSGGYLAQDEDPELNPAATSVLVAPDTMGEWWRRPGQEDGPGPDSGDRGPVVGMVTGFLAVAVAIGFATFAAAFVRRQASPVTAAGGVFVHRLPAALKNQVLTHPGAHGGTVLLLGTIGLIAMALGYIARRNTSFGVAGIAAFGLLGAYITITRPQSRASDVIPSAVGALAGIAALLWLARASAPVEPSRPGYGGGRRRAR